MLLKEPKGSRPVVDRRYKWVYNITIDISEKIFGM
jgi:hypothetical protein